MTTAIPNLESFDNSRVGSVSVQELLKLNFSAVALTTRAFPLFPLRELSKRKPKLGIAEMTITLNKGSLFAQPDGSDKLALLPKAKNKFFIKEIGAEIEFISDRTKAAEYIQILLEGNLMKGTKM